MALSDNDIVFLIAVCASVIGALVYFIPTAVAAKKKSPKKKTVILLNVFLGWTVVAWVVCLVLACKKTAAVEKTEKAEEAKVSPEVETV